MTSVDIEVGTTREVVGFENLELTQKFLNVGILPGTKISRIRQSPLGGTYYFMVDGNIIALRRYEAESIIVR